jgi:LPXTG-motif cell wall-anchored protein
VKTRLIATLAVAGALVLGAQTSAFAADYTGAVTSTSAAPGAVITYTATDTDLAEGVVGTATLTGLLAEEEAVITPASTKVATVVSGENGDINFTVKLPTSAPVGTTYTLEVEVGTFYDIKTLTVAGVPVDSAATGAGTALPSTGVDATPYVWFGGGLLVLGAALVSVLAFVRRSNKTA